MLYYLSLLFLNKFSFLNVVKYITFRSGAAMLTSLVIAISFGSRVIDILKEIQGKGQPIRADGPETHLKKAGTPTMGGLLILMSVFISSLLWADLSNSYIWVVIGVIISFALLGFLDDYFKVAKNNSKGVSGKLKLIWQLATGLVAGYAISAISPTDQATILALPFLKNSSIEFGMWYFLFASFVLTGTSNSVNLTDGLDGLVTGPVVLVAMCLALICYLVGNSIFANYLHVYYVPQAGELSVLCASIIGACLGFLWFNAPPAQIFMGDVGSLALGGAIGAISIITKHELVLVILGGLFVIEALSVIIQVTSFRLRGKRVFKMAPIHHHFEKLGWSETKVVIRFWIIATIFAIAGLSTLKIR
jgi:phospho-N-acetylmuramoyl-pentapeptide-transferase